MSNQREQWGSKLGFILASSGSAVGIGNIWKYPHMAGENGGGAFTIVYLICILIVGLFMLNYTIFSDKISTLKSFLLHHQDFYQRLESLALFRCHPCDKLCQVILH